MVLGDFDSCDFSSLQGIEFYIHSLSTDKDDSDLGVALKDAYAKSPSAPVIVFGGLGGRVDHTLSNLYLLFREQ
jgi:thiamine pyrophosphokinase